MLFVKVDEIKHKKILLRNRNCFVKHIPIPKAKTPSTIKSFHIPFCIFLDFRFIVSNVLSALMLRAKHEYIIDTNNNERTPYN